MKLLRLNQLTDGHTNISSDQILTERQVLDFPYFKVRNDSIFINDFLLISVNGHDIASFAQYLLESYSWELHPNMKEVYLNYKLPYYLWTVHTIKPPYILQLKDIQTGKIREETFSERYSDKFMSNPLEFRIYPEESIAVFFYNTCTHEDNGKFLNRVLEYAFQEIKNKKIKNLFIDVSKNGGGNGTYNEFIFKYLNSKKYNGFRYDRYSLKHQKYLPDHINKEIDRVKEYIKENKVSFKDKFKAKKNIKKATKFVNGIIANEIIKEKYIRKKNSKGFKGKVFVIQGRLTYSAAVTFCESIKQRKMGYIVGEEAGQLVDYCGNIEVGNMPNSSIKFCYASTCTWFEPIIPTLNGFIVPDIPYDVFDDTLDRNNHKLKIDDYKKIIELSKTLK